ncbi:MAG: TonB-dependent receptor, partial [Rhodoglobus sp.]|nr:TonB-dependent receptor [Rhodoglobus sp.]
PTDAVLYLKPKYFDVYPRLGQALVRSNPELFSRNEVASVQASNLADYDAKEETSALYGMGTYRFGRHTLIGGVRFERNEWSSKRFDVRIAPGNVPIVSPVSRGASYDFWLPGLHTRHELTRNLILRGSFNQSYGRPNLAQLTRGRLVALNGNITDGNADLQPAFSNNYDIQLEYYRAGGLYSVGFFYKDIEDFTFVQISRFDTVDANGNPQNLGPVGLFQYSVPRNGSSAKNKGVELIARQRLTFLPELLKGFSAAVSATFTETDAVYPNRTDGRTGLPLPGFSKYLFTSSLEYARGKFFARADYRYRDDYVEGLGSTIESDEFFSAEEKVDLEIGYQIRKGLSVFAYGTNLTKRPQVSYQGYRPFVEDTSQSGRKYTIGVDYRF